MLYIIFKNDMQFLGKSTKFLKNTEQVWSISKIRTIYINPAFSLQGI